MTIDPEDSGIAGVAITLTGTTFDGVPISRTTSSLTDGSFLIDGLPEGTYSITRGTPSESFLRVGGQAAGDHGGNATVPGTISEITLGAVDDAEGYLFAFIPIPRIGLAKTVQSNPPPNPDGSFTITFRTLIRNYSLEPLEAITVEDPLSGSLPGFGTFVAGGAGAALTAGEYTIQTSPAFVGSCPAGLPNGGFDGDSDDVLGTIGSLGIGESCTIEWAIRFEPIVPILAPGYQNQSGASGTGSHTGDDVEDLSHSGSNPDPDGNGDPRDNSTPTPVPVTLVADVTAVVDFPSSVDPLEEVAGEVVGMEDPRWDRA